MNKQLLLSIAAMLVCLGVFSPATANAQNSDQCADIGGAINDNTTVGQVLQLLLDCGKRPAQHALQLNAKQQRAIDTACIKVEENSFPALGPKRLSMPCPLFLRKPNDGNSTEQVLNLLNFCATHPNNVFAVGNLDGGEAHIESADWCAMKFSQNPPPGQEKVYKFMIWAHNRAKAQQGQTPVPSQNK